MRRKPVWYYQRKTKKPDLPANERLTIAQLEKKIGQLNLRIRHGSDKVLYMATTLDPNYNLANALLGQLRVQRDNYQKQLDTAVAFREAGWEETA